MKDVNHKRNAVRFTAMVFWICAVVLFGYKVLSFSVVRLGNKRPFSTANGYLDYNRK